MKNQLPIRNRPSSDMALKGGQADTRACIHLHRQGRAKKAGSS